MISSLTDDTSKSSEGVNCFSPPIKIFRCFYFIDHLAGLVKISFPPLRISWKFIRAKGPYTETSIFLIQTFRTNYIVF